MIAVAILIIAYMAFTHRLAGNGWGNKFGAPWLPEVLFVMPIAAMSFRVALDFLPLIPALIWYIAAGAISYAALQSGTWTFLRWESHDNPNTERGGTLKGLYDTVAGWFGFKLGDEGYAWIVAAIKGFLITLPIGGVGALAYPLGHEIGTHFKGHIKDEHMARELISGALMGLTVCIFWYLYV